MARVTVIGSCNMDLVTRTHRFPRPGEHLVATDFGTYLGGKGANQAVAAARAGASVKMVARVGRDAFGAQIVAALAADGIDVSGIGQDLSYPTGNASIWLDSGGENEILVYPGANGTLGAADATNALSTIGVGDVLLMQLEVPVSTVLESARVAANRGATVVLNAAPAIPIPDDLWHSISVLVVNETEAATLSTGKAPAEAASALCRRGCDAVVVTLGRDGCIVAASHTLAIESVTAFTPHRVVDATGAGDAFCGAFAAHLAFGSSVPEAARWGNAAGSLAVEVLGAMPSMPSKASTASRLRQNVTRS
jgi:ribokinase